MQGHQQSCGGGSSCEGGYQIVGGFAIGDDVPPLHVMILAEGPQLNVDYVNYDAVALRLTWRASKLLLYRSTGCSCISPFTDTKHGYMPQMTATAESGLARINHGCFKVSIFRTHWRSLGSPIKISIIATSLSCTGHKSEGSTTIAVGNA